MKISIIGSGHVGLVTGACFSDLGNEVLCMDHDKQKIKTLKSGATPFYEAGLSELIKKNVRQGRLRFSSSIRDAVQFGSIIFLCVGTPPRDNGETDLSQIEAVAYEIAASLSQYRLIVEKSTVPVETGMQLERMIRENQKKKIDFDVASNPEFLREGSAIHDFFSPDRIVLGVESKRAEKLLLELYKPFKVPILVTDIRSAELIKHASNSFLATKISFINWVSQICERVGADVGKVADGMGLDSRIGRSFLNAGVGFGGSCFPKDLAAFIHIAEKLKVPAGILRSVSDINQLQKTNFIHKVQSVLGNLKSKTVGVLGLAFKPETDDLRHAPAVDIIEQLKAEGAKVKIYDPKAAKFAKTLLSGVTIAPDAYSTCKGADALLVLTEWREFKELDLKRVKKNLKRPIIIDGRNIYEPEAMKKMGFQYHSVGRVTL